MGQADRTWENMDASNIATLETLAHTFDTYASVQATGILNEYAEADYFVPPHLGNAGALRSAMTESNDLTTIFVELYPNPADIT